AAGKMGRIDGTFRESGVGQSERSVGVAESRHQLRRREKLRGGRQDVCARNRTGAGIIGFARDESEARPRLERRRERDGTVTGDLPTRGRSGGNGYHGARELSFLSKK